MFKSIKKMIKEIKEQKPHPISKDEMLEKLIEGTDLWITNKRHGYKQLRLLEKHKQMPDSVIAMRTKMPIEVVEKYNALIKEGWSLEDAVKPFEEKK